MPLVRIEMWPGRTREEKNNLIRTVTDAVVTSIGCPEQAVEVLLYEVDQANWAQGGVCHADRHPVTGSSSTGT